MMNQTGVEPNGHVTLSKLWMARNDTFVFPENDVQTIEGEVPTATTSNPTPWSQFSAAPSQYGRTLRLKHLRQTFEHATKELLGESAKDKLHLCVEVQRKWFDKLVELYCEKHRAYHTLVHLEEMFGYLHHLSSHMSTITDARNAAVLTLSVWFHDAIYNPRSATNEQDSAKLFLDYSRELLDEGKQEDESSSASLKERVMDCILATESHQHVEKVDTCEEERAMVLLFLDVDLSVLGKTTAAYAAYARGIRHEYDFVPHDTYCEKRAAILEDLCDTAIYFTPTMRTDVEEQARSNLQNEISHLLQYNIMSAPTES
jgi:predicted metal-dependent HD superfamily phosphohydrolase